MSPPITVADTARTERVSVERLTRLELRIEDALRLHGPLNVRRIGKLVMARRSEIQAVLAALEAAGRAAWTPGPRGAHVWRLLEDGP